jgi:hypothetical protein
LIARFSDARLKRVSARTRNIVLIVAATVVLIWIVGYMLFNVGGSTPGTGTGDVITEPTP